MKDTDQILNKYIVCDYKYYCPYCGKELIKRERCEDQDWWDEYLCDCEDAEKERDIMRQIRSLQRSLPKEKYAAKPTITKKEE